MKRIARGVVFFSLAVGLSAASLSVPASAHVTVKPVEVEAASFQTFTVSVPNEKTIATTQVKVVIPDTVAHVTPTQKPGWTISVEKRGSGERASVAAISWSGAKIAPDLRDEFTFSAQVPAKETNLQWKAYQTYADGTVVAWDQAAESGHDTPDKGPFSVTSVVTGVDKRNEEERSVLVSDSSVRFALYLSGAAVLLALTALFLATRKK